MQTSDFTEDMPGQLIRTLEGAAAFLPAPLPPTINWTTDLVSLLSSANHNLGSLAGISKADIGTINPHLLIRPFIRREAVLSSQIEGTQASLSDLFLFEEGTSDAEQRVPDVREVANYVKSLEFGLSNLAHRKLSVGLIRELHHVLMTGVRGGDKTPGTLRTIQVFIGSDQRIENARYIPPPPLHVPPALESLEKYLNISGDLPSIIRIALVHYQFEAIHPFQDGNGRIGRLLITLMLCAEKLLPVPMLYLSAYFERNRHDYYKCLLNVSQKGAWGQWLEFFLRGVSQQANDAIGSAAELFHLRDEYREILHHARAPALALKLVDELFKNPAISTVRAATLLGITVTSAQTYIQRFIKAGILKESTGQKRNRIYLATEIVDLLNASSSPIP